MANDLAEVKLWLQAMLMDTGSKSWDSGTLDNSIRLALIDLSQANGAALTLKDLDSAAATTVAALDKGILLIGAAAYALHSRAVDLAEKAGAGAQPQVDLAVFAASQEALFRNMLDNRRKKGFQTSSSAPQSTWEWDEEDAEESTANPD